MRVPRRVQVLVVIVCVGVTGAVIAGRYQSLATATAAFPAQHELYPPVQHPIGQPTAASVAMAWIVTRNPAVHWKVADSKYVPRFVKLVDDTGEVLATQTDPEDVWVIRLTGVDVNGTLMKAAILVDAGDSPRVVGANVSPA